MTTKSALRFVVTAPTSALCVPACVRVIHHSAMQFASCVLMFATLVLPNVNAFQRTIAARNVQRLAKNARRLVLRKFLQSSYQLFVITRFRNFVLNYCQILRGSFLSVFDM